MELCSVRAAQVTVHAPLRLAAAGLFSPDYLYLNPATAMRIAGHCGGSNG